MATETSVVALHDCGRVRAVGTVRTLFRGSPPTPSVLWKCHVTYPMDPHSVNSGMEKVAESPSREHAYSTTVLKIKGLRAGFHESSARSFFQAS
jgi:hypothetical protein